MCFQQQQQQQQIYYIGQKLTDIWPFIALSSESQAEDRW